MQSLVLTIPTPAEHCRASLHIHVIPLPRTARHILCTRMAHRGWSAADSAPSRQCRMLVVETESRIGVDSILTDPRPVVALHGRSRRTARRYVRDEGQCPEGCMQYHGWRLRISHGGYGIFDSRSSMGFGGTQDCAKTTM